jgi:hypothetical protein
MGASMTVVTIEMHFLPQEPRQHVVARLDEVIGFVEETIQAAVAQGLLSVPSVHLAALHLVYIANMLSLHTYDVSKHWSHEKYAELQLELFLAGALTKKGRARAKPSK